MESMTIKSREHAAESITVDVSGTANSFFAGPLPSTAASASAITSPRDQEDRWRTIIENWEPIRKELLERLALFHRSFAEPVKIVNGEIEVNEYAMIAEKPYPVEYKGDLLEFTRKADGSIVISELHVK